MRLIKIITVLLQLFRLNWLLGNIELIEFVLGKSIKKLREFIKTFWENTMNKHGLRNWVFSCLFLIFAFAQLVACSSSSNTTASGPVLIVYDTLGSAEETTALTTLNSTMTAVGYTVTESASVPTGDLSGYIQIWDIRYDQPISAGDELSYLAYVQGGGTLVMTGQNGTLETDASIVALIYDFGGESITLSDSGTTQAQTVVATAFTGPNTVSSVTYSDTTLDGTTSPGSGVFITEDTGSGFGSAIYFGPGTLTNASSGILMVVFDTNFLNPANSDYADFLNLTQNMLLL